MKTPRSTKAERGAAEQGKREFTGNSPLALASTAYAGECVLSQSFSAASMRVCQPAPVALKAASTSGLYRTVTATFVGAFCGPREPMPSVFCNSSGSTSVAGLNLRISAALSSRTSPSASISGARGFMPLIVVTGLALAFTAGAGRGTIHTKAKAPVLQNTFGQAVATPTDKRGFVIPKFWGLVRLHWFRMVYGHGGGYPQGHPRGLSRVLNRHAHPLRVKTQRVVLKSRQGAPTMHPTTSASVRVTTPTTGKSHQFDPIQLHVDAVNACAMASYYTRKGNHAGAARKAVQAVSALRKLAAFERQGVAA